MTPAAAVTELRHAWGPGNRQGRAHFPDAFADVMRSVLLDYERARRELATA